MSYLTVILRSSISLLPWSSFSMNCLLVILCGCVFPFLQIRGAIVSGWQKKRSLWQNISLIPRKQLLGRKTGVKWINNWIRRLSVANVCVVLSIWDKFMHMQVLQPKAMKPTVSWCFNYLQKITLGLKETFLKRRRVERTIKAEDKTGRTEWETGELSEEFME